MQSLNELLKKHSYENPSAIAIEFGGQSLTRSELFHSSTQLASSFDLLAIHPGDHIGLVACNCLEYVQILVAAAIKGVTLVPIDIDTPPHIIDKHFYVTEVDHIIISESRISDIEKYISNSNKTLKLGNVRNWISIGDNGHDGYINLKGLFHSEKIPKDFKRNNELNTPLIITLSSGSTGDPKPIVLSERTKLLRAQSAIELYSITKRDKILISTPLHHSLAQRLLIISILTGASCYITQGFHPENWMKTIQEKHITFTIAVASQIRSVLNNAKSNVYDTSSIRCLVSSSEKIDEVTKKMVIDRFRCDFHECYGASEIAIATNLNTHSSTPLSTIGSPIKGVKIKLYDSTGVEVKPGEIGEIACETPMVFSGYFNSPEKTAASFIGTYFKTGDLGSMSSTGVLTFHGRTKDVIISGGMNIYPKDIENVLISNSEVYDACVVPTQDTILGEIVTAVIVTRSNQEKIQRQLQKICLEQLGNHQQVRQYIFWESLPKNSVGKILRQQVISRLENGE